MYRVYYTDPQTNTAYAWDEFTLVGALNATEEFRNQGMRFVTMVSESPNQVGLMGVDSVEDGRLPSGEDYTWRMRRQFKWGLAKLVKALDFDSSISKVRVLDPQPNLF